MIIDEASKIPGEGESTRALTSLSLVSRAFRERTHSHLFGSITFGGRPQEMEAAQHFLGLLVADQDAETDGLACKIISFSCTIPPSGVDTLVRILNKLFLAGRRPCSFHLAFVFPTSWLDLPEDLARAIFQVCHRPRLAILSICHLRNIPQNFLRHSFVKHLTLTFVSVPNSQLPESWFGGMAGQGHCETVVLEHLSASFRNHFYPYLP
ncbi:hypothetical protein CPC08DRAFT_710640 [Agrocybe pediades]|nr:hypothetical protein CPC08DRAFT_710640 [Agrocybe pediades]